MQNTSRREAASERRSHKGKFAVSTVVVSGTALPSRGDATWLSPHPVASSERVERLPGPQSEAKSIPPAPPAELTQEFGLKLSYYYDYSMIIPLISCESGYGPPFSCDSSHIHGSIIPPGSSGPRHCDHSNLRICPKSPGDQSPLRRSPPCPCLPRLTVEILSRSRLWKTFNLNKTKRNYFFQNWGLIIPLCHTKYGVERKPLPDANPGGASCFPRPSRMKQPQLLHSPRSQLHFFTFSLLHLSSCFLSSVDSLQ